MDSHQPGENRKRLLHRKSSMTSLSNMILPQSNIEQRDGDIDVGSTSADAQCVTAATTTSTGASSSSPSRKRVVSELETATSKSTTSPSITTEASSLAELRRLICDEQFNLTTLQDYQRLLQTEPTMFQNTVWRERVAQWFYDVLDYLEESRDLAFVAMNILDRYLAVQASTAAAESTSTTEPGQTHTSSEYIKSQAEELHADGRFMMTDHFEYEVLSITSLFLAVRIAGNNRRLTVPEMLELTSSGVQVRHVLSAGNTILQTVSWDHRTITPHNFLTSLYNYFVQSTSGVIGARSSSIPTQPSLPSSSTSLSQSSLLDFAAYLIEVSVCDTYFTQVLPSEVALAALVTALTCDEDTGSRCQASFALFLQSIQTETGIDIDSPRMKSIVSRLLDVYNQSQEAATSRASINATEGSHDLRHDNQRDLNQPNIQHQGAVDSHCRHVIVDDNEDDNDTAPPMLIPQYDEDLFLESKPIRTISPHIIRTSSNASEDVVRPLKRAKTNMKESIRFG